MIVYLDTRVSDIGAHRARRSPVSLACISTSLRTYLRAGSEVRAEDIAQARAEQEQRDERREMP